MTVRISRAMVRRILAHAAEAPGREVCGLLLGGAADPFAPATPPPALAPDPSAPAPAPFALSLSKGCSSPSLPSQKGRTGLRQAQPERGGGSERGGGDGRKGGSERKDGSGRADGSERGAGSERIDALLETPNVASDPATTFEIDPAALFAALRAERAGGPRILGHYHSHPSGSPTPSARDAAMALQPGRLWLIVAAGAARMWREVPGGAVHGAFALVELVVDGADDGCT